MITQRKIAHVYIYSVKIYIYIVYPTLHSKRRLRSGSHINGYSLAKITQVFFPSKWRGHQKLIHHSVLVKAAFQEAAFQEAASWNKIKQRALHTYLYVFIYTYLYIYICTLYNIVFDLYNAHIV